ncbi:MAG: type II toxin-antitoxin system HicB family antitoxin [Planctomycetaceae bacterium]
MEHKGYTAHVEFDDEENLFYGKILGIRDVVTFQGSSVDELQQAFRDSVDDYLDFCQERGEAPDKPFSGRFVLRMKPELHRVIDTIAKRSGKSLNGWVVEQLESRISDQKAYRSSRSRKTGTGSRPRTTAKKSE